MNKQALWFSVCVFLLCGGCSTSHKNIPVSVSSDIRVKIWDVRVASADGELSVDGRLRPVGINSRQTGHVDIDYIGPNETVILQQAVSPSKAIFSRKSLRDPVFSASAAVDQDVLKKLRLSHHKGSAESCMR